jgi:hypothetical protein
VKEVKEVEVVKEVKSEPPSPGPGG